MSAEKNKKKKPALMIVIAIVIVVLLLAAALAQPTTEKEGTAAELSETVEAQDPQTGAPEEEQQVIALNEALVIREVGNYTGIYMEDGTDDPITGILKIVVTNVSEVPVQYAKITMDVEGETAAFAVTALPAGESAVLLEQNRMAYSDDVDYMNCAAKCENLALFDKELSLHEDKLKIQTLDGALNITNVSGADITDTIILCYKSYQNDMYYGGIAYRIKLEGGLKAGELRQIMVEHFREPGSRMVFADFAAP